MGESPVTYTDLLTVDLGPLGTAVGDWKSAQSALQELSNEADDGMRAKSDAARWKGVNAGLGKRFVRKIANEVGDLHSEARTIWNLLDGAHTDLVRIQEKAKAQQERAKREKIRIQDNGDATVTCEFLDASGTFGPISGASVAKEPTHTAAERETKNDIQDSINALVAEARMVDQSVQRSLGRSHGNDPHNAGHATYNSLDDAQAEQAAAYARKQLKLYEQGKELPTKDLESFAALTKHNAKDPEFATALYRDLGPQDALRLHAQLGIDASSDGGQARLELARVIQNSMGTGLATATDAPAFAKVPPNGDATHLGSTWINALKRAGRSELDFNQASGGTQKTLGYQVLGNILRHGNYDTKFLNDVGNDMVAYEREHGGDSAWPVPAETVVNDAVLNLDKKGGVGFDPMIGLMEGLGNSPEAATDFFSRSTGSGDDGDFRTMSNLDYLLGTGSDGKGAGAREWVPDPMDGKQYGKDALGHALEAGTTGMPSGESRVGTLHSHTPEQAAVMKDVVEAVAKNPGVTDKGIADSFGRMAADYMPEINLALTQDAENFSNLYKVPDGVSKLSAFSTVEFLDSLARHPNGYAEAVLGAHTHQAELTSDLNKNAQNYDGTPAGNIKNVAFNTGAVEGILSSARSDEIVTMGQLSDDDYNKAVAERGEHIKSVVGQGVGAATERVPVAGELATQLTDKIIDSVVESHERNTTAETADKAGETSFKAREQSKEITRNALDEAGHVDGANQDNLARGASTSNGAGFTHGRELHQEAKDSYDRRVPEHADPKH